MKNWRVSMKKIHKDYLGGKDVFDLAREYGVSPDCMARIIAMAARRNKVKK